MRVELIIGLLFCLFGAYAKHSWSQRTRAAMFVTGSMFLFIGAVRQLREWPVAIIVLGLMGTIMAIFIVLDMLARPRPGQSSTTR